mmetsp:Transcript_27939/g.69394  ORF Transcript_27939/g.69394 Transcript_27939/m.69394 type:complete len:224 (-) Transcript_27939:179-850(-)
MRSIRSCSSCCSARSCAARRSLSVTSGGSFFFLTGGTAGLAMKREDWTGGDASSVRTLDVEVGGREGARVADRGGERGGTEVLLLSPSPPTATARALPAGNGANALLLRAGTAPRDHESISAGRASLSGLHVADEAAEGSPGSQSLKCQASITVMSSMIPVAVCVIVASRMCFFRNESCVRSRSSSTISMTMISQSLLSLSASISSSGEGSTGCTSPFDGTTF